MPRLLLVEDNEDLGHILSQYLEGAGFSVTWARNGVTGMTAFRQGTYDCCVLDIMMPLKDGFTLAAEIQGLDPNASFLFLTSRREKEDRIRGLRLQADDYITKPFDAEELVLRIRNILRRKTPGGEPAEIPVGKYLFDFDNLVLKDGSSKQRLTLHEARLIRLLVDHSNTLVKREVILEKVWGKNDYFLGRSMDVFITRIRKFFREDPAIRIESTRGIGITFWIDR